MLSVNITNFNKLFIFSEGQLKMPSINLTFTRKQLLQADINIYIYKSSCIISAPVIKLFINSLKALSQPAFTCSKLTIEILEQRGEICSKSTIKTPNRCQWHHFGVFIVNFEHISHLCSSASIVNFEHVLAGWYNANDSTE